MRVAVPDDPLSRRCVSILFMGNIRRYDLSGSAVFITAVCFRRRPMLKPDREKERLLSVMREVKSEKSYQMLGYVIMDDHFHCLIRPEPDSTFSQVLQSIKLRFTRRYKRSHDIAGSFSVWQKRFWDHVIRNPEDLRLYLDYLHYNPVKHGCTSVSSDYRWSSLSSYVARGRYECNWAAMEMPKQIRGMEME